jgi:hypothetical protein
MAASPSSSYRSDTSSSTRRCTPLRRITRRLRSCGPMDGAQLAAPAPVRWLGARRPDRRTACGSSRGLPSESGPRAKRSSDGASRWAGSAPSGGERRSRREHGRPSRASSLARSIVVRSGDAGDPAIAELRLASGARRCEGVSRIELGLAVLVGARHGGHGRRHTPDSTLPDGRCTPGNARSPGRLAATRGFSVRSDQRQLASDQTSLSSASVYPITAPSASYQTPSS